MGLVLKKIPRWSKIAWAVQGSQEKYPGHSQKFYRQYRKTECFYPLFFIRSILIKFREVKLDFTYFNIQFAMLESMKEETFAITFLALTYIITVLPFALES